MVEKDENIIFLIENEEKEEKEKKSCETDSKKN